MKTTELTFCTKDYNCGCHVQNVPNDKVFNLDINKYAGMITNSTNPRTYIEITKDDTIVGTIYVKKIAAPLLKRMCQPATVKVGLYITNMYLYIYVYDVILKIHTQSSNIGYLFQKILKL